MSILLRSFSVLALTACSSPMVSLQGLSPAEEGEIVVQDDTVLLDQDPAVQSIEVGTGQLILHTDGSAVGVSEGSVVVGRLGGGYLRRVTQVVEQGDRVVLLTEHADLSDAILNGKYHAAAQIADRTAHTWDIGGRVLYSGDVWSSDSGDYVNVNAFIAEGGQATIEPNFDFDIELFNGHWIDAGFEADVALDYNADFVVQVDGAYGNGFEGTLLTRNIPFEFSLGPVPVIGVATVELVAGVQGQFLGSGTTTLHTEANAFAMMEAGYDDEGWHFDRVADLDGDIGFIDTDYNQAGQVQAYLSARMSVTLYGAAGAELTVEPWLELNTCMPAGVDIDGGVRGDHRYFFRALGWFDFDSGTNDFDFGPYDIYAYQCDAGY